ncbi:MAG: hypothetical protein HY787_04535 [Deltaproteobacteria bacterium]|nr:hypothetical protein [Deltaproteobacteria bacterium]
MFIAKTGFEVILRLFLFSGFAMSRPWRAMTILLAPNALPTLFPSQAGKKVEEILGLQQQAGPEIKAPF